MQRILLVSLVGVLLANPLALRANDDDPLQKILSDVGELRKIAEKESQTRADEAKAHEKALDDVRQERIRAQEFANELKLKLAAAEVELMMLRKQNQTLERLVGELERRDTRVVEEIKSDRPSHDVRGKITAIADAGLYVLSVGTDEGLKQGHVLEVFRLGTTPPLHLGNVTLVRAYAKQSIGQFKPNGKDRADVGDEVGNRIFSK